QIDPPADDADEPPITQPDTPVSRARPVPSSWAGTVAGWLMEDSRFIRQAITQTGTRRSGLWAHGFHSQGERRASGPGNYQTSDVAGNHTGSLASHGAGTTRDISGVFVGLSADIHPQWRLGGVVGGSHSHIRGVLDSSRIETSHLGLYAHGEFQPAEVTLGAALAHHRIKNQRTAWAGQLAHGARFSHRAQTRQVFGRLALNAWGHQHARTHIQPFIETVWLQHKARAATETGGPLALAWHKQRHARGYTSLGLQARHQLDLPGNTLATLSASLGWRQLHGKRHLHTSHHYR